MIDVAYNPFMDKGRWPSLSRPKKIAAHLYLRFEPHLQLAPHLQPAPQEQSLQGHEPLSGFAVTAGATTAGLLLSFFLPKSHISSRAQAVADVAGNKATLAS